MVTSSVKSPDQQDIYQVYGQPTLRCMAPITPTIYLNVNMTKIVIIVNMTKIIYINIKLSDHESMHPNGLYIRRAHQMGYAPMI